MGTRLGWMSNNRSKYEALPSLENYSVFRWDGGRDCEPDVPLTEVASMNCRGGEMKILSE